MSEKAGGILKNETNNTKKLAQYIIIINDKYINKSSKTNRQMVS